MYANLITKKVFEELTKCYGSNFELSIRLSYQLPLVKIS